MIACDQLAQMKDNIRDLITQQPSEAQKGRRIADNLLGLAHCTVEVGLLLCIEIVQIVRLLVDAIADCDLYYVTSTQRYQTSYEHFRMLSNSH